MGKSLGDIAKEEAEEEMGMEAEVLRSPEQRAQAAVALRLSGAPHSAIAKTLGYTSATDARIAVERTLAESAKESRDLPALRQLTSGRLERLLRAVWKNAVDDEHPDQLAYTRTALAIIDRHARLMGVDAPQKMEVYTPDQQAQEDWIRGMLAQVGPKGIAEEADIIEAEIVEANPDDE